MRMFIVGAFLSLALAPATSAQDTARATFAGGCFWCVERDFDKVDGVLATVSGFTGGALVDPSYRQVVAGGTGHREAVEITYDPARVTYEQLLEVFWHSVDPTDAGGQFCDRGFSYTTAVYVHDATQQELAEASKIEAETSLGRDVATAIEPAGAFYPAEAYHQDYYLNNPNRYRLYRWRCGRDARVRQVWGERAYAGLPTKD